MRRHPSSRLAEVDPHSLPCRSRRGKSCDSPQPIDRQMESDIGSMRMTACKLCTMLDEAMRECEAAKRLADEDYSRTWTVA
jgi:hypothetical protein